MSDVPDQPAEPVIDMAAYEAIADGFAKSVEDIVVGAVNSDEQSRLVEAMDPKVVEAHNAKLMAASKEGSAKYIKEGFALFSGLMKAYAASHGVPVPPLGGGDSSS